MRGIPWGGIYARLSATARGGLFNRRAARSLVVDQSSRRNKRDDRLGEVQALVAMGRLMLRSPLSIPGQRVGALTQVSVGPLYGRYPLIASNYCSVPVGRARGHIRAGCLHGAAHGPLHAGVRQAI